MSWLALFLLWMLANLMLAPWVFERARKEMDRTTRRKAPGGFVKLSQGMTHYQWHGRGRGPIIVMVHGLTTPSWVFQALIPGLTLMGFRVLTYDLCGRGFSDRPTGQQDEAFFLTQLEELLDVLEIDDEISLFGYSMGGAIATAYCAKHLHRVDRLMLLAPAGIIYRTGPLLKICARLGVPGGWLWDILGGWDIRRAALADQDASQIPDLHDRVTEETRTRGYLRSILSSERHMLAHTQETEHRAIAESSVAVISIWAERDTPIPLSAMGKLTEWNRTCYKYEIKGAGHGLGYTHPDDVITPLQEHLREV
ncbi:alpha/beta fold hydrolase [Aliiroseovarius sp. KMU-50]|uniref:Alpha/beta fold hydrolase n=1 Tax=Aliiroseovarius salicola TaxID=3009082 RepID=A0ABT4W4G8_9RHOB|nr:alpha/beta fold hydrolase [Aliiroseovarius sp. KMU-50]MDA5095414.1 alpha/beta fold hydrolase [Aliiroseovarius sp. KMU-50]